MDFSYNENKKILEDLSLEGESGTVVAVVGPTGSGKTTIISLLTKFYDIDSGKISIDGRDINSIKRESLRRIYPWYCRILIFSQKLLWRI